jgi:SM-20-related protein
MAVARYYKTPLFSEEKFDELIDCYVESNVGVTAGFLNEVLAKHLKANLSAHYESNMLQSAGTGNKTLVTRDKLLRSDKIYWLDRMNGDVFENEFFDLMDRFIQYLNATCYTGITGYEFHYTLYESGSFYKKHVDQFRNDEGRKYSMVMYLNDEWTEQDGGELCIHHTESDKQYISPTGGKSIFFRSNELEHEVLITHKPRMSITGWLK